MTTATFNKPSHVALGPLWMVDAALKVGRNHWRECYNVESNEAKAHRERFLQRQWQPIMPGSRQALRLNRMQDDGFAPEEDPYRSTPVDVVFDSPEFEYEDPHSARFTD